MTTCSLDSIRVAYGVVWHAGVIPKPGGLVVGSDSLRLVDYEDHDDVLAKLAFGDLSTLRIPTATKGRRSIVLESRLGEWIEIESAVDQWILPQLLEQAITHLLAASSDQRVLLSIRLRRGTRRRAFASLSGELRSLVPPSVRDVFVLDDEVLLLFEAEPEAHCGAELVCDVVAAWHDFILEIGFADRLAVPAPSLLDELAPVGGER